MATAHDLHPRPLWDGEVATRGDLHFADSFCRNSSMTSKLIAVGTASRTNHVGIVVDVSGDDATSPPRWTVVEALRAGLVKDTHPSPPMSVVIRLSDDVAIRDAVARAAEGAEPVGPGHPPPSRTGLAGPALRVLSAGSHSVVTGF